MYELHRFPPLKLANSDNCSSAVLMTKLNDVSIPLPHCSSRKRQKRRLALSDRTEANLKRFRSDSVNSADIFVNGDISVVVFSFLGIKELYKFVMLNKVHRERLKHEHVVQSAMMSGGHAKTSIDRLVRLIKKRRIWIPSPLRMLRLTVGKYCEKCKENKVNIVSEHFGVFYCCQHCITNTHSKLVAYNQKWTPYLEKERVAKAVCTPRACVWAGPANDDTGERCGPLITMTDMERMMPNNNSSCDENLMGSYLQNLDAQDPHSGAVDRILQTFNDFKGKAEQRQKEKYLKKCKATEIANENRKLKTVAMLDDLSNILGDVPWKNIVMDYDYVKKRDTVKIFARFKCNIVNNILSPFALAPSKASKKKLNEAAQHLTEKFGIICETNFHDFTFLSQADPLEITLCRYFQAKPTNYLLTANRINSRALELIRGGHLIQAILHLDFDGFMDAIRLGIVSSTIASKHLNEKNHIAQLLRMAHGLWETHYLIRSPKQRYQKCIDTFPVLYERTLDFLSSPETNAWKQKYEGTRDSYVDIVWNYNGEILFFLLNRDYKSILDKFDWYLDGPFA